MSDNTGISKIRSEVAYCAVKLALLHGEIEDQKEDGSLEIKDRQLYNMLTEAQVLCNKICAYINLRWEPHDPEYRDIEQRILDDEL